jgi:carbon-monoxide dehydrogenase large subunit
MTHAQFVGRLEDARLLTGAGRYASDWNYPGQLHAAFLRSDQAHADIVSFNAEAARKLPGVVAVLTHEDVKKAGFGAIPVNMPPKHRDGRPTWKAQRPVLAEGRVRHVGECVACVVADSHQIALDALELIEIEYRDLPAVAQPAAALEPGAPQIHPEVAGNLFLDWEIGNAAKTEAAFAAAAHRVSIKVYNNRVIAQPMEPRSCVATHDEAADLTVLHCPTQGVHMQLTLLVNATGLKREQLNIVAQDVGGGFGARSTLYPEYVAVVMAARLLKRPVKWTGVRSEVFLYDVHARDCVQTGELALDKDFKFLAMRFDFIQALGAYSAPQGSNTSTVSATICLTGEYDVPAAYHRTRLAVTNTMSTAAYRGAGRPLMSYIVERLVDQAAQELKIDPIELRRRNLVPANRIPYEQAHGIAYDSGDFKAVMEKALLKADWAGFDKRLDESKKRGKLRGRGIATFIEASGAGRELDNVILRVEPDGTIALYAGAQSQGQSHETTFAQIVSERTGLPMELLRLKSGDGTRIAGTSAGGSKTMVGAGSLFSVAAKEMVGKGAKLAAKALEAPEQDIEFDHGEYRIKGTDRRITLLQLVDRHKNEKPHPLDSTAAGSSTWTFPNSCHICELEVDPDTGNIEILKYSGVDDAGVIINHQVVEGQMHGGIAQGAGQVLAEHCIYDKDSGQLLTGSFMDYPMPRATSFVEPQLEDLPTPTTTNALGVKGVGEAGVTGSLPTVMNAVMDALRRGGVTHFDMPCTPQRVWAALQAAKAGKPRELSIDKAA